MPPRKSQKRNLDNVPAREPRSPSGEGALLLLAEVRSFFEANSRVPRSRSGTDAEKKLGRDLDKAIQKSFNEEQKQEVKDMRARQSLLQKEGTNSRILAQVRDFFAKHTRVPGHDAADAGERAIGIKLDHAYRDSFTAEQRQEIDDLRTALSDRQREETCLLILQKTKEFAAEHLRVPRYWSVDDDERRLGRRLENAKRRLFTTANLQHLRKLTCEMRAHEADVYMTRCMDFMHRCGNPPRLSLCPPEKVDAVNFALLSALDRWIQRGMPHLSSQSRITFYNFIGDKAAQEWQHEYAAYRNHWSSGPWFKRLFEDDGQEKWRRYQSYLRSLWVTQIRMHMRRGWSYEEEFKHWNFQEIYRFSNIPNLASYEEFGNFSEAIWLTDNEIIRETFHSAVEAGYFHGLLSDGEQQQEFEALDGWRLPTAEMDLLSEGRSRLTARLLKPECAYLHARRLAAYELQQRWLGQKRESTEAFFEAALLAFLRTHAELQGKCNARACLGGFGMVNRSPAEIATPSRKHPCSEVLTSQRLLQVNMHETSSCWIQVSLHSPPQHSFQFGERIFPEWCDEIREQICEWTLGQLSLIPDMSGFSLVGLTFVQFLRCTLKHIRVSLKAIC